MGHDWAEYSSGNGEKAWRCTKCQIWTDRPSGYPRPSKGARVNAWIYSGDDKMYSCEEVQILTVVNM